MNSTHIPSPCCTSKLILSLHIRCLNCPPLGTGVDASLSQAPHQEGCVAKKHFDSEAMRGRNHAKEAAVAPAVNAGPMDGGVGPISSGRTGRCSDSPNKSFLEPAK